VLNAHLRGAAEVEPRDLFEDVPQDDEAPSSLQAATRGFQKRHVLGVLEAADWNVSEAARRLEVARSHVYNLITLHDLRRGPDT